LIDKTDLLTDKDENDASVVVASTPLTVHSDEKEAVAAVLGLRMKYSKFYELFMNSTRNCPARELNCADGCASSVSQSVCLSIAQSVSQSISQLVSQPASQSVSQSINQSDSQSVNQSSNQSVSQSISSASLSVPQSSSLAANHSYYHTCRPSC